MKYLLHIYSSMELYCVFIFLFAVVSNTHILDIAVRSMQPTQTLS